MPKPKYPKIGDEVTILDPRPITRLGYDLCTETLIPEVAVDPAVTEFIRSQRLCQWSVERLIRTIAVSRVLSQMRRGAERKIYYGAPVESLMGTTAKVLDKRVRQLGFYYPPWGGYVGEGDYDYEPGGLNQRKTVVCLLLNSMSYLTIHNLVTGWNEGFWVTSEQVKLGGRD